MFSDRGSLTANVKSIQPAGVETIVVCEAGNQVVVVQSLERIDFAGGGQVQLSVDPMDVHMF